MVLADTSVWIEYLRTPESAAGMEMAALLEHGKLAICGVVIVEILQGVASQSKFAEMEEILRRIPLAEMGSEEWLKEGDVANRLRRQGRMIPFTDLTIAMTAVSYDYALFTLDKHFERVPGLRLHAPEQHG